MQVLFLDIDGVCNCATTPQRFKGFLGIDPVLAARVKRIIKETKVDVVLSSTWRLDVEFRAEVRRKVCKFVDVTPEIGYPRAIEMTAWLKEHPEVTKFAALDDNADFLRSQPLFKTDFNEGITDKIADKVIKYFNS